LHRVLCVSVLLQEWLKKIAESNPEFRVITFTSTDCSTCYVKPVQV